MPAQSSVMLADILLLFVAVIWGASYAVAKETLVVTSVAGLIFFRFLIATALLVPLFRDELRQTSWSDALRGGALGVILSCIFLAETVGVLHTTATNAAFLISLCILLTPLFEAAAYRRRPPLAVLGCAVLSLLGTGLMVWKQGELSFNPGDVAILIAAVLRALVVVATKRLFQDRTLSSGVLSILQMGTVMVLSGALLVASQGLPALIPPASPVFWTGIAFLSLFCTLAAFFIQNWAVRRTSPTRVSFLMGTEPFFGALFAMLLLGEVMAPVNVLGAVLILCGTVLGIRATRQMSV